MFISHLPKDKTQYRTTRQRNCTPGGLFFMPCTLPYPDLPRQTRQRHDLLSVSPLLHPLTQVSFVCPKKGCARFGKVFCSKILFGCVNAEPGKTHTNINTEEIHASKDSTCKIAAVQWREQRPRKYPCQALPACRPGASPGSSRGPPPPAEALRAARRVGSVHASARGGG